MNIGGFAECTLVDYPDKVACIVYTVGCNFRCKMCYNVDLISDDLFNNSARRLIPEQQILDYIEKHSSMLDAVVLTGGEPLMQFDLIQFCQKVKDLNKLVKLDTNGGSPDRLQKCIDAGVVDYIAMDIKGPLNKYKRFTGYDNTNNITKSIEVIKNSGIPAEFRLTLYPELTKEDIVEAIHLVKGQKIYLQNFEPEHAFSEVARELAPIRKVFIDEVVAETKGIADVRLRGF